MKSLIGETMRDVAANVRAISEDPAVIAGVERAAETLVIAFRDGHRVFSAGNGGSLCDAMHFAEELSGSFRNARPALPAVAIADAAHLTCVANDFGYERVFARYVEAHVQAGDVLLAISTSGRSPNVVTAAHEARGRGAAVIALTGRPASELAKHAEVEICTPVGEHSDRVQEMHIVVIHLLVELVERELFPENYAAVAAVR